MIADYKNPDPTYTSSPIQFWRYFADVKNISNTYPYGKSYGTNAIYNASEDYRYGFNGMEKEKNMDASGDITDFGARVYDANFPMFLSPDPKEPKFGYQSTYVFAGNNPILFIDYEGTKKKIYSQFTSIGVAFEVLNITDLGKKFIAIFDESSNYHIYIGDAQIHFGNNTTGLTWSNSLVQPHIKGDKFDIKIDNLNSDSYAEYKESYDLVIDIFSSAFSGKSTITTGEGYHGLVVLANSTTAPFGNLRDNLLGPLEDLSPDDVRRIAENIFHEIFNHIILSSGKEISNEFELEIIEKYNEFAQEYAKRNENKIYSDVDIQHAFFEQSGGFEDMIEDALDAISDEIIEQKIKSQIESQIKVNSTKKQKKAESSSQ